MTLFWLLLKKSLSIQVENSYMAQLDRCHDMYKIVADMDHSYGI